MDDAVKSLDQMPPRVRGLKDAYLQVKPSITIGRAKAYTEVYREFPGLPNNMLRAKGFRRACETAPLLIQGGELIVGHPCGSPRAGAFSPDTAWRWLTDELETIATRPQDPYFISEEDKRTLREEIFPFWQGKSLDEACEQKFRDAGLWEFAAEACISDLSYHYTSGGGDTSPGYDIILFTQGVNGLKAEAEARLAEVAQGFDPEALDQINYYQAAIETCEGILTYSRRLSAYALELAEKESDPVRKTELVDIARVNARVPANPPETFHEALQAIWTIQSLFLMEENQCSTSLGRIDQYVFPAFARSMADGMTQQQALELMGCFIIKCSEMIWYTPEATATYFAGYMPFINMCVGGVKREGGDATNDLTYLVMDAVRLTGMYQPSLACRVHNLSPHKYLEQIVEVTRTGMGMPAIHFDDAHIRMMLRKGFDFDDARDYCLMGCVEPQKSGRIHQWTAGGFTQWPITLEMMLNRGFYPGHGSVQGIDTGPLEQFTTYEQFDAAVKDQLIHLIAQTAKGTLINQKLVRDTMPNPYMSLWVDGCMRSGKDVTAGGAYLYEGPGTIFAGLGTYVDSMAAIRHLVFDQKRYTLEQFRDALATNWEGYELMRLECLRAPKYGNDNDYADLIAADIVDFTEKTMNSHKSLYARMIHGTLSQSFNTPLGGMVGATPDGRYSGKPLSDGMSPSQGADNKGPTAVVKSVSKINVESMSLGMSHNFKLVSGTLETPEARMAMIQLLRTASQMGNAQMQFNYVDNATLIDAQKHPEKHRDLIMRVAGYSAFFVELCKEVQDEIISRTALDGC
ncbi:choline trimethylamine-lyase [Parendozoicomonas haliclonae]|uniref:Choline trimethylamine-lyase n=1 Tax=Parendozoicomonas haliclonae TaxID=1960125 RepID=A0A1X7ASW0_9GAMM|nr:choline trimethylamine-lyase [Parendozoicomonas haliclonae]SMA50497.1 Benzylsuccinate synthase alpha subunit [Parendozoicomonas haliclonae]